MKIPKTKPSWTNGQYALFQDGVLLGYFRQFVSAHRWRDYLIATTDGQEFYITRGGEIQNIWRRSNRLDSL
jgi:hypothetical protein